MRAYKHILNNPHIREKPDVLECSGNTLFYNISGVHALDFFTLELDRPLINLINTGQHVEYCSLTCSVRSDDTDDLALMNLEADVLYSNNTAESFRYSVDL